MLANLAASLIKNGSVRTTDAKAKEIRPFVEKMVTFARRGDLHARRIVISRLRDAEAAKKLFDEIGPKFADRFGGYTRILKLGFRPGDNSPMSLIQFVEDEKEKKVTKKKKSVKSKEEIVKDVAETPGEKDQENDENIELAETTSDEKPDENTAGVSDEEIQESKDVVEAQVEKAADSAPEEVPESAESKEKKAGETVEAASEEESSGSASEEIETKSSETAENGSAEGQDEQENTAEEKSEEDK